MNQEKNKDVRIPFKNSEELEELQNTLLEILIIVYKTQDEETIKRCGYWLSKIILFSKYPH